MKGLKIARKISVYATTALVSILTFATAVFQIGGAIAYENAPLITETLGQDYSSVIEIDQGADAKDTQYYKTKFKTVEEVRESGVNFTTRIMEEGAVLLKNENNALPISDLKRVNLFGWGATDEGFLLKGVGSGSSTISTKKQVTLLDAFDEANVKYNYELIDFYNEFGAKTAAPSERTAISAHLTDTDSTSPLLTS